MVRSNIPSSQTVYSATLLGATPGTATASKAVVPDASNDVSGFNDVGVGGDLTVTGTIVAPNFTPIARTATSDGLTTGTIADAGTYQAITVTSAGANNIIVLPTPTPGTVIDLYVGANGYELRSSAPATVLIGSGTGGAAVESAVPANSWLHVVCVDATHWVGLTVTAATLAVLEAAA